MKLPEYLSGLTRKQVYRLNRRCWDQIDKRYGRCSWDSRTLKVVFPGFHEIFAAIRDELNERCGQPE